MGKPVDFEGTNVVFGPPEGRDDVGTVRAFRNKACVVVCWELTPDELREIVETGRIYISQMSNGGLAPHYVGTRNDVRAIVQDYGGGF
jgi:hypothetical protein